MKECHLQYIDWCADSVCVDVKDEEDVYGEEARGEDDADDDDDEGQEAEVVATLRANVLSLVPHLLESLLTDVSCCLFCLCH